MAQRRADPGVRRGDYLVAGTDVAGMQGQLQGGRAVVQADAMVGADVPGEGLLEPLDRRSEDELRLRKNASTAGFQTGAMRRFCSVRSSSGTAVDPVLGSLGDTPPVARH